MSIQDSLDLSNHHGSYRNVNAKGKIPDITNVATNTTLDAKINEVNNTTAVIAKINEVKNKISSITNLINAKVDEE